MAAGAVSNDDYASLDETSKARLSVLVESESLPRHLVPVRRNLPDAVVKRLREILLRMVQMCRGVKPEVILNVGVIIAAVVFAATIFAWRLGLTVGVNS